MTSPTSNGARLSRRCRISRAVFLAYQNVGYWPVKLKEGLQLELGPADSRGQGRQVTADE